MRINRNKLTVTKLPRSVSDMFPNVTECYDSDRAIDIEVSNIDIHDSKPLDPTDCAIAKAFKREAHVDAAIIGISSSYLIKGHTAIRFKTPIAVRGEIINFDRHGDFQEGHYYLIPPSVSKKLGQYNSGSKENTTNHVTKRIIHKTEKIRVLKSGVA